MSLRLRPLREDELPAYIAHGRADYERDMVEHAGVSPKAAKKKASDDWSRLLPDDTAPPGNYLFAVEDAESGERVGDLWWAEREGEPDGKAAFVYAIEIFPDFRGRGFGREGMLLLEDDVRSRGLSRINLNVFGGNKVGRSLYHSLGYAETAVFMAKNL